MPVLVTSNFVGELPRLSGSTRFRMLGPVLPMSCPARMVITFFFAVAGIVMGVVLWCTTAVVWPVVVLLLVVSCVRFKASFPASVEQQKYIEH